MPTAIKIAALTLMLAGCRGSALCDRHCKAEGWESGYSNIGQDQCVCESSEFLYRIMKGYPSYVCAKPPKPAEETD